MQNIRKATEKDALRIAEILNTNFRLYYLAVDNNDWYHLSFRNTEKIKEEYLKEEVLNNTYVFVDNNIVKGVLEVKGKEIDKLYVEPALLNKGIENALLNFAINELKANSVFVLKKLRKELSFYKNNGFKITSQKELNKDDKNKYCNYLKLD